MHARFRRDALMARMVSRRALESVPLHCFFAACVPTGLAVSVNADIGRSASERSSGFCLVRRDL